MTDPGDLAEYFGFTEQEISALCEKYEMSFEEAKTQYDGYQLIAHRQTGDEIYSMYSPKSVVEAMLRHKFGTYWNQTETYEALKIYIQMDTQTHFHVHMLPVPQSKDKHGMLHL